MSIWINHLRIKEEFQKAKNEETKEANLLLLQKIISELKRINKNKQDNTILDLIEEFEYLKDDLEMNNFKNKKDFQDDFNYLFNDLYDWADISLDGKFGSKKNCWIETF